MIFSLGIWCVYACVTNDRTSQRHLGDNRDTRGRLHPHEPYASRKHASRREAEVDKDIVRMTISPPSSLWPRTYQVTFNIPERGRRSKGSRLNGIQTRCPNIEKPRPTVCAHQPVAGSPPPLVLRNSDLPSRVSPHPKLSSSPSRHREAILLQQVEDHRPRHHCHPEREPCSHLQRGEWASVLAQRTEPYTSTGSGGTVSVYPPLLQRRMEEKKG